MAPIPVKQPKGVKPLPLEATLRDLSNIHTQNIDLSVLLDQPAKNVSSNDQSDEAVNRSRDFIQSVRNALEADASVTEQGDRVEDVRAALQEIEAGFS
jgi:hypothetical protein